MKSATIRGKVLDFNTREELVGAIVFINDLKKSTTVGFDGSFILKDIPKGKFMLTVKFIGYETLNESINIEDEGIEIVLDLKLKSSDSQLNEIEVVSSKDNSTEISARETEKNAASIVNVVSAKAIELSPDLNIANVLQRMSGITLDKSSGSGGQYALLRGMDKRYNYTLVNGIKIPSTNNKHRYVPLDIFPADLVDRVEVTKALTPDLEGDAIGGVVNLMMKNAPENFLVQTNVSGGFSQFFVSQPFKTFNQQSVNLYSPYELNPVGYNAVPKDFSKDNLDINQNRFPLNSVIGLTIGNRFLNNKLGVLVSANYQNTKRGTQSTLFDDDLSRDGKNLPIVTDMRIRLFNEAQQNLGLHSKLDFRFNNRNKISLYLANMHFENKQLRMEDETSLTTSYAPELGIETRSHSDRFRFNVQNLFNSTLQGDHQITPGFNVNWSLVYSIASNQSPDEASIQYGTSIVNYKQVPGFIDFDGSSRRWRRNTDTDLASYLNLKYQFKFFNIRTILSGGALYRQKTRTSFYNSYTLIAFNPNRSSDSTLYSAKGIDWNKYSDIQWTVRNPRGSVGTSENFDANEDVMATYGMLKFDFNKFQVITGLRIEQTLQGYGMLFPAGEKRPSETYTYFDFLPSINMRYLLTNNINLRSSYYRATNKPGFQEIVPFILRGEDYSSAGNPDLKQAVGDNLDFRFEYFPNKLDQLMAGFFYKKIQNVIEYAFVDYLGNTHEQVYSPINSDVAVNYGFELDAAKFKRQFGIKLNYTWTNSQITTNKLSRIKTKNNQDSTIYVAQTRPLYGQSAHVANFSLLYLDAKSGLNAQLAFSYTGERLYTVSRYINNDFWQQGFWQMDFSCEKKFKNGLSVFAKCQNLLNTPVIVFIKNTNPANYDKPEHDGNKKTTLIRSEYSMPAYLLGLRFKLEKKLTQKIKPIN
jgi:TonB-dependent receptor